VNRKQASGLQRSDLIFNVLKAFKQLEAAEVNPSLLAYSVILNKDPDNYQSYTPQYKIGKSLNNTMMAVMQQHYLMLFAI
jgi:hypothetical protein